jgi:hypothetical protein
MPARPPIWRLRSFRSVIHPSFTPELYAVVMPTWTAARSPRKTLAMPRIVGSSHCPTALSQVSSLAPSRSASNQDATPERFRVDRHLDEALTHGPDPLHLAEVFGLDEETAIRYANSARAILEGPWQRPVFK